MDVNPQSVPARLIEYQPGRHVALAQHTTYGLIKQPAFVAVPGAAPYAYGLLLWQEMRVPLIDLGAALHGSAVPNAPGYAVVVAWQSIPRGPLQYGALALAGLPRTITVRNADQCALPDDSPLWPRLAVSCFRHEGEAVPILDTRRLFTGYLG